MASAKTVLRVTGLAEPGFPSAAESLLSAFQGVEYAHVKPWGAKVTITYDDSVTGAEALIAELKQAGFEATQD